MNTELNERFREIAVEDNFFVLFIILIVFAFIANDYEKKYFINKNDSDKTIYYYLQIFIFSIVVLVNIYYVYTNYLGVVNLRDVSNNRKKKFSELNLLASIFALIAGSILLYIAIVDVDIDAEISL